MTGCLKRGAGTSVVNQRNNCIIDVFLPAVVGVDRVVSAVNMAVPGWWTLEKST